MCFSYPLFIDATDLSCTQMRLSTTYQGQGHFYILSSHLFFLKKFIIELLPMSPISVPPFMSLRDISTNTDCYAVTYKDLRRHLLIIYPPAKFIF